MLGVELNIVIERHLWPRALLTPFTDAVVLTDADRRAYAGYARAQRHKGFQQVLVDFGDGQPFRLEGRGERQEPEPPDARADEEREEPTASG
jgi:hypothetical protein